MEYGLDSSTGVPSRSKRHRSPAPRAAASASVFSQSRRRLPARDICSSAGDCRPRTKLRASARLADAVSCTVRSRSRAVAVSPSSSAFSAERPISTMLEKPWARVSCISRASRARSVSVPASCWLRASSPRVRRNSSAASRWFSASRYSARYARPVTTAKAAPNTGPSTIGSSRPVPAAPLLWNQSATTTSTVDTAMTGRATRRGSTCSCRKKSGKASQTKSALAQMSTSHRAETAPSHHACISPRIKTARVRGVAFFQDRADEVNGREQQRKDKA